MPRFSGEASGLDQRDPHIGQTVDSSPSGVPRARRSAASIRTSVSVDVDLTSPPVTALSGIGFVAAAGLLLMKFATIPELVNTITGVNLKLLYFVGPIAYLTALVSPEIRAVLRDKAIVMYLCFYAWMVMGTPFSSWPGNSAQTLLDYLFYVLPLAVVGASLISTWRQLRFVFFLLAVSNVVVLIAVRMFSYSLDNRVALGSSGVIGDPNDLSAHLILLTPFTAIVMIDRGRNFLFRLLAAGVIAYSIYVILASGSRGALIALAVLGLFVLWKANAKVRIGFLVSSALILTLVIPILPEQVKNRFSTLFGDGDRVAEASMQSREYLFWRSVEFTLDKPLFGVGVNQFPIYEGQSARDAGFRGNWHNTHCTWTQISSESGIPALIFYLGALACVVFPLLRIYRRAHAQGEKEVAQTCFFFLASIVGYFAATTFLSHTYYFQGAAMIGLAVAVKRTASAQLEGRLRAGPAASLQQYPARPGQSR